MEPEQRQKEASSIGGERMGKRSLPNSPNFSDNQDHVKQYPLKHRLDS